MVSDSSCMNSVELKKVLIVDDEKNLANVISAYLTLNGYSTTISLDSRDAFQKARNAHYDIIVTDLKMPRLSGPELINNIRTSGLNNETPIILSSGVQEDALQELKGTNLSKVKIVPDPFTVQNLLNIVKEFEDPLVKANSSKLDANFVNLVLTSTIEIISEISSSAKISVAPPQLLNKASSLKADISGILALISSEFQGSMSLSFKTDTYLKTANLMLKEKFRTITEENDDHISEMLSLIGTRIRSLLNSKKIEMKKTVPSCFYNENHELPHGGNPKTLVFTLESPVGPFWLTVVS